MAQLGGKIAVVMAGNRYCSDVRCCWKLLESRKHRWGGGLFPLAQGRFQGEKGNLEDITGACLLYVILVL